MFIFQKMAKLPVKRTAQRKQGTTRKWQPKFKVKMSLSKLHLIDLQICSENIDCLEIVCEVPATTTSSSSSNSAPAITSGSAETSDIPSSSSSEPENNDAKEETN